MTDLLGLNAIHNGINNWWEEEVGIGHHDLEQRRYMVPKAMHHRQANHRYIICEYCTDV